MVRLVLSNEILGFSSAHISKISGKWKLHGHNFRVQVILEVPDYDCGGLNYFEQIRQTLKVLDHKVIVPLPRVAYRDKHQVNVNYEGNHFTFPLKDCYIIDVQSTSLSNLLEVVAEILSEYSPQLVSISTDGLTWIEKRIKGLSV